MMHQPQSQPQITICQKCGKNRVEKTVSSAYGLLKLCKECDEREHIEKTIAEVVPLFPELRMAHSPLSVFVLGCGGFREAALPLTTPIKKETVAAEVAVTGEEGIIDWNVLVGAEPREELKNKGLDHVLAAEYAERMNRVTVREIDSYLQEMAKNPDLETHLSAFKTSNEDRAREILNYLADLRIVKKERKAGERGANVYEYWTDDSPESWKKETS